MDGWMDEEDELFLFFFCGLGWVVGWQYSSVDLFFAYKVPLCFVFSLLLFLGEDCCCTLLI